MTKPVAFLLPGQGSQYPQMAAGLYRSEPVFTDAVDEIVALLGKDGELVRADWLTEAPARPSVPIDHVTRSQVLLFIVDYALSRQIMSWGIEPTILLGHSAGELVAAALSGIFELPDAVALLWDRVQRLADAPPGGMLAVAAKPGQVEPYLRDGVVIGIVNSPSQLVLAGPQAPLEEIAAALTAAGRTCRAVPATAAFHSPGLAPLAGEAVPLIDKLGPRPPRIPVHSGYTTRRLTAEEVADPRLWAAHPVEPVLFWPALETLLAEQDYRLVEAGPGQRLATVARRHPAVARGGSEVFAAAPARPSGPEADRAALRSLAEALLG
ncbi:hypothetical protein GCM10022222_54830 [Amycolatopsis ultiminotia]|uniref:Malonyl-CoA:ACP transacylase (MAT) domain-containing protein n=1 Tax=Amycolatopsis ultiminotia TaxID=543629 RepID=A0ABP6XB44_9PSEU